jgi:hypothetical protein
MQLPQMSMKVFDSFDLTVPSSDSAPVTFDLQNRRNRGVRCGGMVS